MKNLNSNDFETLLNSLYACPGACKWAKGKDLLLAWNTCERGNWMLWLLGKMADKPGWLTHKELVLVACNCAEISLKYLKFGENRPAECIATVRRWVAGEATIEDVKKARSSVVAIGYNASEAVSSLAAVAIYHAEAAVAVSYSVAAATYADDNAVEAKKNANALMCEMCRKAFQIED